jgi:UDP-glucose 4-epimerase
MPVIANGKFVVLGGASQVGSHIGEQLLAGGAREVVLLDNLSLGSADAIEPLLADRRCRFVRGDVLRLNELVDAFDGAEGVFAVAAFMASSIGENPWAGMDVNIRGLQNALEACRWQRVKKIVISSSTGVYGAPEDDPTNENSPLRWQQLPPSMMLYCASKVIGEGLARLYRERHGLDFVALRYSAVYGERQHRRALVGGHIADSCERIRRGERPVIDGDGAHVHDYIHAGDAARANLMAMQSDCSGEGINICSGVDTAQRRVVEIALQACGSALEPEVRPRPAGAKLPPSARQAYSRDKARRLLGWEPQVSIEDGIARVLRWIDSRDLKTP